MRRSLSRSVGAVIFVVVLVTALVGLLAYRYHGTSASSGATTSWAQPTTYVVYNTPAPAQTTTTATRAPPSPPPPPVPPGQPPTPSEYMASDNVTFGPGNSPWPLWLWRNMTVLQPGTPEQQALCGWLSNLMSGRGGYNWSIVSPDYGGATIDCGAPLRLAAFNLSDGAQVLVVAFDGGSGVDLLVLGRVANETEWLHDLLMTATLVGGLPVPSVSGPQVSPLYLAIMSNSTSDLGFWYGYISLGSKVIDNVSRPLRYGYALWLFAVPPASGPLELSSYVSYMLSLSYQYSEPLLPPSNLPSLYLGYGGARVPVTVYVALEEPAYLWNGTSPYDLWYEADDLFWEVVGYPTISLAVNLQYDFTPYNNATSEAYSYYVIPGLTYDVALANVVYPPTEVARFTYTPLLANLVGYGVCSDQSTETVTFMADALGAAAIMLVLPAYDHAVSVLLLPGNFSWAHVTSEPLQTFEAPLANGTYWAIKIDDTYGVPLSAVSNVSDWEFMSYAMWRRLLSDGLSSFNTFEPNVPEPPFGVYAGPDSNDVYLLYSFYLTGVPLQLLSLPPMFQAPWAQAYYQAFNATGLARYWYSQAQALLATGNYTGQAQALLQAAIAKSGQPPEPPSASVVPLGWQGAVEVG